MTRPARLREKGFKLVVLAFVVTICFLFYLSLTRLPRIFKDATLRTNDALPVEQTIPSPNARPLTPPKQVQERDLSPLTLHKLFHVSNMSSSQACKQVHRLY